MISIKNILGTLTTSGRQSRLEREWSGKFKQVELMLEKKSYKDLDPLLQASVEWLRGEIGNPDLSPEWFNQLGLISEAYTGDFNLARTCFQSAWDVAEKQNDKYQKALSMTNLGVLNLDQNRPAEAVEIFNELKPFVEKQFGDESRELAVACQNLASAYQLDGREEEAKEERIRATGILRKIS